uniref:Helicase associated domain protein n=1 Tax=Agathobacter sp. TaxID=2021311 RepID=UPI00405732F4
MGLKLISGMAGGLRMDLDLFEHNRKAYEAACRMMETEGKAAVIHPTGTGKSFIGFKLALECPDKGIVWLSPSEHIFRTQVENVMDAMGMERGGTPFPNVTFLTYAKLMHNEGIIENLSPGYIILDEFHRCGAAEWGQSVKLLLEAHPNAKVLGFSATNIRYLDSQRDMAQEIFGGNIASEMSLGEAIGRGILPAPTYICAVYDWQAGWKALKKRVEQMKHSHKQKENEALLEQMRRALSNAEGPDRIFERHMQKKKGKYIVFCSGREHMEEMAACVPKWFAKVDRHPHVYKVCYDRPESGLVFEEFKKDESDRLRLLFSIDMLNEGIHVGHLDGVILLRPTVSPILYLQQIGRGLAVGGSSRPLVFDLVNNFDSLYAVHGLAEEAKQAYNMWNRNSGRVPFGEHFRIIDEVRECRELFEGIKRNLSAGWEAYYQEAECFFQENGHLQVAKKYVSPDGLNLGMWLMTQRRIRAGKTAGNLTAEQIEKLDKIGMTWEDSASRKWENVLRRLEAYKKEHGNIDIPTAYVAEDGFALGKWVSNTRSKWRRGEYETFDHMGKRAAKDPSVRAKLLTIEQMSQLNVLGMVWDKYSDQWNKTYIEAEIYWKQHGNLEVPHKYVTEKGTALGVWVDNQRNIAAGKKKGAAPMSESQKIRLEAIGMVWDKVHYSKK